MNRSSLHWPGYYDVVILPPPAVWNHAMELSARLYRAGGQWRLGKRAFLPHISLYHIPVRAENLSPFLHAIDRIAGSAEWGSLETKSFDMPVMTLSKPAWLTKLHYRIVNRTVRYFDREYGVEKLWSLQRHSGRRLEFARKYLQRFGTPLVGMNFAPHITLNSFKGKEPADDPYVRSHLRHLTFPVDRLYVCELGQSHSCQRILHVTEPEGI